MPIDRVRGSAEAEKLHCQALLVWLPACPLGITLSIGITFPVASSLHLD